MTEKFNKYEASAQKLQRAQDAKKAASDYEIAAAEVRAKTERLRALRLARDAAVALPAAPKRKTRKKSEGSLSNWLDGQAKEGRNR